MDEEELLAGFRHKPGKQAWIGEHVGPRWGLATGGIACLTAAAYGLRQQRRALEPAGEPWITASARIA